MSRLRLNEDREIQTRRDEYERMTHGKLETVAELAASGCTDKQIAVYLNVPHGLMRVWYQTYRDFRNAVDEGRMKLCLGLRKKVVRLAKGCRVKEETYYPDKDTGELKLAKVVVKSIPPNMDALNTVLSNYDTDWHKNKDMWRLKKAELKLKQQTAGHVGQLVNRVLGDSPNE